MIDPHNCDNCARLREERGLQECEQAHGGPTS